jgi:hypothetical protein
MGTTATVTFEGVAGQVVGMAYDNVVPMEADSGLSFSLHGPGGQPGHRTFSVDGSRISPWDLGVSAAITSGDS